MVSEPTSTSPLREKVVESDTFAGKAFDVALIVAILASVVAVMLDSVGSIRVAHGRTLAAVEWTLAALFTVEYVVRISYLSSTAGSQGCARAHPRSQPCASRVGQLLLHR